MTCLISTSRSLALPTPHQNHLMSSEVVIFRFTTSLQLMPCKDTTGSLSWVRRTSHTHHVNNNTLRLLEMPLPPWDLQQRVTPSAFEGTRHYKVSPTVLKWWMMISFTIMIYYYTSTAPTPFLPGGRRMVSHLMQTSLRIY